MWIFFIYLYLWFGTLGLVFHEDVIPCWHWFLSMISLDTKLRVEDRELRYACPSTLFSGLGSFFSFILILQVPWNRYDSTLRQLLSLGIPLTGAKYIDEKFPVFSIYSWLGGLRLTRLCSTRCLTDLRDPALLPSSWWHSGQKRNYNPEISIEFVRLSPRQYPKVHHEAAR